MLLLAVTAGLAGRCKACDQTTCFSPCEWRGENACENAVVATVRGGYIPGNMVKIVLLKPAYIATLADHMLCVLDDIYGM